MSDERDTKVKTASTEVSVNWEGVARFFRWSGSLNELKRARLDQPLHSNRRDSSDD